MSISSHWFRFKGWLQRTCDRDFACRIQLEIVLRGKIGSCVLRANMCEEKNKNESLWSLECALQQGLLGFRFRV
jgi:hypothetical protein